jgi:hypothetical protein
MNLEDFLPNKTIYPITTIQGVSHFFPAPNRGSHSEEWRT